MIISFFLNEKNLKSDSVVFERKTHKLETSITCLTERIRVFKDKNLAAKNFALAP